MPNVKVITDSTAYLPKDLVEKYDIQVCPQVLIWGEETYEDGIDIMPNEFYKRLESAKIMPSTSQVTPAYFLKVYNEQQASGREMIAVLISNKLSGTIASAVQARDQMPEVTVEIVDSTSVAMALGFQALSVARAAAEGASLAECKAIAEKAPEHVGVVFAVETLEFLHRGGRIGGANRFLGTALNIKPILEVTGGRIEAVERVRTRKKSINRLLELVGERIDGRTPLRLATLHANAPEEAAALLKQAEAKFNPVESFLTEVSPVIGTHAGPGTVGLAYMAGM